MNQRTLSGAEERNSSRLRVFAVCASECPSEKQGGGGHGQDGKTKEERQVGGDGKKAGVLEGEFFKAVHGIGERVDNGDCFHPRREGLDGIDGTAWKK